jgi:hypothetical protein
MIRSVFVGLLMLAVPVIAQKQDSRRKPQAAVPPPEVKKTVDAITGSWYSSRYPQERGERSK